MPYTAVLKGTLNGKSRQINVGDLHLMNPLDILATENTPMNKWGKKAKFSVTEE